MMSAPTDVDLRIGDRVVEFGACHHKGISENPRHLVTQTFGTEKDCFHYETRAVNRFSNNGGILARNWLGYVKRLPEGSYARQNR